MNLNINIFNTEGCFNGLFQRRSLGDVGWVSFINKDVEDDWPGNIQFSLCLFQFSLCLFRIIDGILTFRQVDCWIFGSSLYEFTISTAVRCCNEVPWAFDCTQSLFSDGWVYCCSHVGYSVKAELQSSSEAGVQQSCLCISELFRCLVGVFIVDSVQVEVHTEGISILNSCVCIILVLFQILLEIWSSCQQSCHVVWVFSLFEALNCSSWVRTVVVDTADLVDIYVFSIPVSFVLVELLRRLGNEFINNISTIVENGRWICWSTITAVSCVWVA